MSVTITKFKLSITTITMIYCSICWIFSNFSYKNC